MSAASPIRVSEAVPTTATRTGTLGGPGPFGGPGLDALAAGLAARLRDLAAAATRSAAFVASVALPARTDPAGPGGQPQLVDELIARTLRTLGHTPALQLLDELAGAELAGGYGPPTGQPAGQETLARWEQVNDLIQVGLVRRDPATGRVGLTGAGAAVAQALSGLRERVCDQLGAEPAARTRLGGS